MNNRIVAVDVLRGFTVLLMTIVNNPGTWSYVYPILAHASWNGCTLADLVFPFFIFIVGISIPLAMPIKKETNETYLKIITRSIRIFCLGLFLGFFFKIHFLGWQPELPLLLIRLAFTALVGYALMGEFKPKTSFYISIFMLIILLFLTYGGFENFADVRIPGVLQRIGIVYLVVAMIYLKTNIRTQIIISILLLLGYWTLLTLIPVPEIGKPNLEIGTNFVSWFDSFALNGHMYIETKTWDPEGILSTIPAIVNGLLGLLIGQFLINSDVSKTKKAQKMLLIGLVLVIIGIIWGQFFPINKPIWTSSYVLLTSGLALVLLTIIYFVTDILEKTKWTKFFIIWGVNPMIVFFLSGIIPRAFSMIKVHKPDSQTDLIGIQEYFYNFQLSPMFQSPYNASFSYAILYVLFWSLLLYFFYKKKWIFKV